MRSAGYTSDRINARLGVQPRQWVNHSDYFKRIAQLDQKPIADSLDLLIRLFLSNTPIEQREWSRLGCPVSIDGLLSLGLAHWKAEGFLQSDISIFECNDLLIATDAFLVPRPGTQTTMPLFPESYELARSVTRECVDSTLDLCTGSGVHALLASRHSRRCHAIDISARTIQFAAFNAWLNEIHNIEFAQSDLFAAVDQGAFDLITANPPYMPVSDSGPGENFYSGGKRGDAVSVRILRELVKHLKPGGICQIIQMIVLHDDRRCDEWVKAAIGFFANDFDVITLTNKIAFRNENTSSATSVEFGVINVKRRTTQLAGTSISIGGAFNPPLDFDIRHLFAELERVPEVDRLDAMRAFGV